MTEVQKNELNKIATKQQNFAANPNSSVWVEASAGTGKTKVLSDRVLRLLLNSDFPHPERILCLTYTKAGAVEMKSRIYERLSEWAIISDENLQKSLSELFAPYRLNFDELKKYQKRARILFAILLDTPGGMKIQTIHSFCQDLLHSKTFLKRIMRLSILAAMKYSYNTILMRQTSGTKISEQSNCTIYAIYNRKLKRIRICKVSGRNN